MFNECLCPQDASDPHPHSPYVCVPRNYVIGSDSASLQTRYSGNDLHIPQMMLDHDLSTFWVSGLEVPTTVTLRLDEPLVVRV